LQPEIRSWEAIELLAFGPRWGRTLCPLCGGSKNEGLICPNCLKKFGEIGIATVKAEIGRRNLWSWPYLTGESLSLLFGNGGTKYRKKIEISTLPEKEDMVVKRFPEARDTDDLEKPQAETEHDFGEELKKAETKLEDSRYEIFPGMLVWPDIMEIMAFNPWQEWILCPVCRERKRNFNWLCSKCAAKFGIEGVYAVKVEVARLNPKGEVASKLGFAFDEMQTESLPVKNLRENKGAIQCLLAFLLKAHHRWEIERKKTGQAAMAEFLKEIGYSMSSWLNLKKDPVKTGISMKKAREICKRLNISIEDALRIGRLLLEGNP